MTLNQNYKQNQDVDLIEVITVISRNKLKVFLFIFIFTVCTLAYLSLQKPIETIYEARTEIKSITSFEEFEYEVYNNYLSNSGNKTVKYPVKVENERFIINEISMDLDNSSFRKIDKEYLINLFIEKINENKFLLDTMMEFGLIDKNSYKDNIEYKNAVMKLADSFQLLKNNDSSKNKEYVEKNSWIIKFQTKDLKAWEKYLNFIENETNNHINKYLNDTFNNLISNQIKIKNYKIEDIDLEISNSIDPERKKLLISNKQKLIAERDIDRLKFAFKTTPIVTGKEFYAGNILYESTEFKDLSKKRASASTLIILSIVLGSIVGILYVLIIDAINRRN